MHSFIQEYLTDSSKKPENEYHVEMVVNKLTGVIRLKLENGRNAFAGIHSLLMHFANCERFNDWCTAAVQWEM